MKSAHKKAVFGKVIVYAILILIAVVMIIPFLWMLSASIKSDREVFQMNPFVWIPANPRWDNYVKIWTKIPFGRFVGNTVYSVSYTHLKTRHPLPSGSLHSW